MQLHKTRLHTGVAALAGMALAIGAAAENARATVYSYTIDPSQSSLFVSGNLTGNPAGPQTSGSLSTSFSGTIVADVSAGAISFPGGSSANAQLQSSDQQPYTDATPGSAPADYGRIADGPFGSTTYEAIRDLSIDVQDDTSGSGIALSGGSFASNSLVLVLNDGNSDALYDTVPVEVPLAGKGTANSSSGGPSTLTQSGNVETLTLKISSGAIGYSVEQTGDSSINFSGTLVATRTVVPEPATAALCALAGMGLLRRRRRA